MTKFQVQALLFIPYALETIYASLIESYLKPSSLKEHPSASYYPVLNWIIANTDGCSFKLDGVAKGEDIFPSSLKEHHLLAIVRL